MFYFFFPNTVITRTTRILKTYAVSGGKLPLTFTVSVRSKKNRVCLLLQAQKNQLFVRLHLSTSEAVFWYFRHLFSVQLVFLSYLHFLHINANLTNMLLSISCGLEAMDQQVKHSLIRTFPLLKEILRLLGRLFHEEILGISNSSLNSNYLLCPVIVRVIESLLQIYFSVFFLS